MAPVKSAIISSSSTSLLPEDESCLAWLAAQEEASVLYIAFGSLHGVSEAVLHDLAMAVEASGVKFLWVLRADQTKLDSRDNERNGEKEEEEKNSNKEIIIQQRRHIILSKQITSQEDSFRYPQMDSYPLMMCLLTHPL